MGREFERKYNQLLDRIRDVQKQLFLISAVLYGVKHFAQEIGKLVNNPSYWTLQTKWSEELRLARARPTREGQLISLIKLLHKALPDEELLLEQEKKKWGLSDPIRLMPIYDRLKESPAVAFKKSTLVEELGLNVDAIFGLKYPPSTLIGFSYMGPPIAWSPEQFYYRGMCWAANRTLMLHKTLLDAANAHNAKINEIVQSGASPSELYQAIRQFSDDPHLFRVNSELGRLRVWTVVAGSSAVEATMAVLHDEFLSDSAHASLRAQLEQELRKARKASPRKKYLTEVFRPVTNRGKYSASLRWALEAVPALLRGEPQSEPVLTREPYATFIRFHERFRHALVHPTFTHFPERFRDLMMVIWNVEGVVDRFADAVVGVIRDVHLRSFGSERASERVFWLEDRKPDGTFPDPDD